jgi:hypothetical protein
MHELAGRLLAQEQPDPARRPQTEAGYVERAVPGGRAGQPPSSATADTLRRSAPTHLRGVQEHFAQYLTDSDVVALARVFGKLVGAER